MADNSLMGSRFPPFNELTSRPPGREATGQHNLLARLLSGFSDRTFEDTNRDVGRFASGDPTMTDQERRDLVSSFVWPGVLPGRMPRGQAPPPPPPMSSPTRGQRDFYALPPHSRESGMNRLDDPVRAQRFYDAIDAFESARRPYRLNSLVPFSLGSYGMMQPDE